MPKWIAEGLLLAAIKERDRQLLVEGNLMCAYLLAICNDLRDFPREQPLGWRREFVDETGARDVGFQGP